MKIGLTTGSHTIECGNFTSFSLSQWKLLSINNLTILATARTSGIFTEKLCWHCLRRLTLLDVCILNLFRWFSCTSRRTFGMCKFRWIWRVYLNSILHRNILASRSKGFWAFNNLLSVVNEELFPENEALPFNVRHFVDCKLSTCHGAVPSSRAENTRLID